MLPAILIGIAVAGIAVAAVWLNLMASALHQIYEERRAGLRPSGQLTGTALRVHQAVTRAMEQEDGHDQENRSSERK